MIERLMKSPTFFTIDLETVGLFDSIVIPQVGQSDDIKFPCSYFYLKKSLQNLICFSLHPTYTLNLYDQNPDFAFLIY